MVLVVCLVLKTVHKTLYSCLEAVKTTRLFCRECTPGVYHQLIGSTYGHVIEETTLATSIRKVLYFFPQ